MKAKAEAAPLVAALERLPRRILAAVSGGRDSVALLDALVASGREPVVVHFDHRWRAESGDDARFVRALAKQHGLPFVLGKTPAAAPRNESTARRLRGAFFARTAKKLGIHDLVLAHHADDQVETFLLQLLRGTGTGWHGMEDESVHGKLTVHRPWLAFWREEIAAYAARRKLAWREDATNLDPKHLRNRVRHRLVPLLEAEFDAAIRPRLLRTAEIQRANRAWIDALVETDAQAPRLAVKDLLAQPVGRQRHLLRLWLQGRGIADLSFDDIEAARGLLINLRPAKINLSRGRHLRRQGGFLFVV